MTGMAANRVYKRILGKRIKKCDGRKKAEQIPKLDDIESFAAKKIAGSFFPRTKLPGSKFLHTNIQYE